MFATGFHSRLLSGLELSYLRRLCGQIQGGLFELIKQLLRRAFSVGRVCWGWFFRPENLYEL